MRTSFLPALVAIVFFSCKKEITKPAPPANEVTYTDFANRTIGFNQSFHYDLDGNGTSDFFISTALIGSPIERSDFQDYYFNGTFDTYTPVNDGEQVPKLPKKSQVSAHAFAGYEWYNASQVLLSRRRIPSVGQPAWEGDWKASDHAFIPLSIYKAGQPYFGWVELSFDMQAGAVILHRAAIGNVANQPVWTN